MQGCQFVGQLRRLLPAARQAISSLPPWHAAGRHSRPVPQHLHMCCGAGTAVGQQQLMSQPAPGLHADVLCWCCSAGRLLSTCLLQDLDGPSGGPASATVQRAALAWLLGARRRPARHGLSALCSALNRQRVVHGWGRTWTLPVRWWRRGITVTEHVGLLIRPDRSSMLPQRQQGSIYMRARVASKGP